MRIGQLNLSERKKHFEMPNEASALDKGMGEDNSLVIQSSHSYRIVLFMEDILCRYNPWNVC
jgi:hypothetical protein